MSGWCGEIVAFVSVGWSQLRSIPSVEVKWRQELGSLAR